VCNSIDVKRCGDWNFKIFRKYKRRVEEVAMTGISRILINLKETI